MRKMRKKLNLKLSASYNSMDQWCLEVKDEDSGLLVIEIAVEKEEFFQLMSSLGGRPAKGTVYPNFETLGKRSEHESFSLAVTDEMRARMFPQSYSVDKGELNKYIEELNAEAAEAHEGGLVGPWIIHPIGEATRYGDRKMLNLHRVRYHTIPGDSQ